MENLQGVSPEDNEADDAMPQGQIADDVTLESKLVSRSYLCFVFNSVPSISDAISFIIWDHLLAILLNFSYLNIITKFIQL